MRRLIFHCNNLFSLYAAEKAVWRKKGSRFRNNCWVYYLHFVQVGVDEFVHIYILNCTFHLVLTAPKTVMIQGGTTTKYSLTSNPVMRLVSSLGIIWNIQSKRMNNAAWLPVYKMESIKAVFGLFFTASKEADFTDNSAADFIKSHRYLPWSLPRANNTDGFIKSLTNICQVYFPQLTTQVISSKSHKHLHGLFHILKSLTTNFSVCFP